MSTTPSVPATPPARDGTAVARLDIAGLAHPSEFSRLLFALCSTVAVVGAVMLWIVILAPEATVPVVVSVVLFLLLLTVAIWLYVLVQRARLLGSAILVTPDTLPRLASIVHAVRTSLDYHRRVDVYVAEKVSGTVSVFKFMGTRIILLEGGLVADLQEDAKRPQLVFLLGSMFGRLKARHRQFTLLTAWLEGQENLAFLRLLLAPYFRATTYSGDQLGAACCNDIQAAGAMMNRLLVGRELSPDLLASGVLDQAARVRTRWLPRFAQLAMDEPHLTNRFLNLMAFAAWKSPAAAQAYFDTLDPPTRQRLVSVIETSPHRRTAAQSRRTAQGLTAAFLTVAVLILAGLVGIQARTALLVAGDGTVDPPTSSGPPAETAAEVLLSHLPSSFIGRCQEENGQDAAVAQGLLVEFSCSPASGGPGRVYFLLYESLPSLEDSFAYLTGEGVLAVGTCRSDIPGQNNVEQGSVTTGRFACYQTDSGDNVLLWTDLELGIMGQASDASMIFGELRRWQLTAAQLR